MNNKFQSEEKIKEQNEDVRIFKISRQISAPIIH